MDEKVRKSLHNPAAEVYFKCEFQQVTGSFKARGAMNASVAALGRKPGLKGVVTHSSGNHGKALAWAASNLGLDCVVVVPKGTPEVKRKGIEQYGAEVMWCEANPTSRKEMCEAVAKEREFAIVPPFDNYDVIAGQSTIGSEILEQLGEKAPDAVLIPVSGGGMSSGIATVVKEKHPEVRLSSIPLFSQLLHSAKSSSSLPKASSCTNA